VGAVASDTLWCVACLAVQVELDDDSCPRASSSPAVWTNAHFCRRSNMPWSVQIGKV
jgi:hypothetical protein